MPRDESKQTCLQREVYSWVWLYRSANFSLVQVTESCSEAKEFKA